MPTKRKNKAFLNDPDVYWMIRRKSDGWFSVGGIYPSFSRHNGKCWFSHAEMLHHFRLEKKTRDHYNKRNELTTPYAYLDCEVVQFRRYEEAKLDYEGYGQ